MGYDINCGVRLLATDIDAEALRPHLSRVMAALYDAVPAGVGGNGDVRMTAASLRECLALGSEWAVSQGHGTRDDLVRTESGGRMALADSAALSPRALERGLRQVGTLGAGNHFLEVDEITEVYDGAAAAAYGLAEGKVCVWIHCGSRGLGHQVCSDAVRDLQTAPARYGITLPDRELVCAPVLSDEGQHYLAAMSCAANYAWANRQVITSLVRRALSKLLRKLSLPTELRLVYDVCHNIAKIETHQVNGREMRLCVHRKGATRAFGPEEVDVPDPYRGIGQPVLIPGSMGTGSYVLKGTDAAMSETFGSTCHGAGRVMSRTRARKTVRGETVKAELGAAGIVVRARSARGLAEEAPLAYKDVESVVQVVHDLGISRKVGRTRPLGVIKG